MAKVKEKMSWDVVYIEATKDVPEAAALMLEKEKGALPVTDEGLKLVGMLTDRDIISVVAQEEVFGGKRVRDLMTEELVTIGPEQDEDDARQLMADHQLDRILVTHDDNRLLGIISEADIRSDEGPLSGGTDTVGGVTKPVSGVTDTVSGTTDKLLGGGGEKQR